MKLSDSQVAAIGRQTGAEPVSHTNPAFPQLVEIFGSHTFYVDAIGLHIVEALPNDTEGYDYGSAVVIQIAEWIDENKDKLAPIDPKPGGTVLKLDDGKGEANDNHESLDQD